MPREIAVVINRHAHGASRMLRDLQQKLRDRGLEIAEFHPARNSRHAAKLVRRLAKAGAPAVLVGGGDGTMTRTADVLAHGETILGVLPLGTGNSFARSLGFRSHDVDGPLDALAAERVERIDLGTVNGCHFANFATVGISSEVARRSTRSVKNSAGLLAYAVAALPPLLAHPAFRAELRWKAGRLALETQDVIVVNGRFFGISPVTPNAHLQDGTLTVFTGEDSSRVGALRNYLAFTLGRPSSIGDAHVMNVDELSVEARPAQRINVDGHILGRTPARFGVARGALRVYVPPGGVAGT